jgi:hypothetical protein
VAAAGAEGRGPRMWRYEGAPLSREDSLSGGGCLPNTQPPGRNHDRGPRKRLRLTLANDEEAAWHGFVLPPSSPFAVGAGTEGTEGQDGEERMLMAAAGELEGMHMCVEEEEEVVEVREGDGSQKLQHQHQHKHGHEQERRPLVFGEGMTTGQIVALRQRRQQLEQEAEARCEDTSELPNSSRYARAKATDLESIDLAFVCVLNVGFLLLLTKTNSGIERFNASNACDKVHPAAG